MMQSRKPAVCQMLWIWNFTKPLSGIPTTLPSAQANSAVAIPITTDIISEHQAGETKILSPYHLKQESDELREALQ